MWTDVDVESARRPHLVLSLLLVSIATDTAVATALPHHLRALAQAAVAAHHRAPPPLLAAFPSLLTLCLLVDADAQAASPAHPAASAHTISPLTAPTSRLSRLSSLWIVSSLTTLIRVNWQLLWLWPVVMPLSTKSMRSSTKFPSDPFVKPLREASPNSSPLMPTLGSSTTPDALASRMITLLQLLMSRSAMLTVTS